jgi:MSHA type pilus biogenesis protein MshL
MYKYFIALTVCILFFQSRSLAQDQPTAPLTSQKSVIVKTANTQSGISETILKNRISLDIKGMEITDVLKMLATRAGMNIVIGKNISGKITVFLKEVDIQEAFDKIILSNDLDYEKEGDIINIMTQQDYALRYGERFGDNRKISIVHLRYAKSTDLLPALVQLKTPIGKVIADQSSNTVTLIDTPEKIKEMESFIKSTDCILPTKIFDLNYAKADKIEPKIQELVTKGIGSVKIDERTNKIAVTDYPARLNEIEALVSAFDEKSAQVLIDAQIIEITPSDKFEMGIDWDFWIKKYFEIKASLPVNTTNTFFVGTPSTSPTSPEHFKSVVDILRTIGDTKVLSSPRIMVVNNQEAKILVGTKDAYITSTISQPASGPTVTSQAVNFVDVGIKLFVTPTITKDGFITMKIRPEISSAKRTQIISEDKKTEVPIVTTSEAETTVMVKDGVTLIIGGLRKDKREKTTKRIPILGDIPLLGYMFGSTSDEVSNTELVILLTPHLMSGEKAFTDFSDLKPRDGLVAKMVKGEIITERIGSKPEEDFAEKEALRKYSKLIFEKIKPQALSGQAKGQKGEIKVTFIVLDDGTLYGEPQIVASTNPALAPFAIEAIKNASPFPALKESYEKRENKFSVTLSYE